MYAGYAATRITTKTIWWILVSQQITIHICFLWRAAVRTSDMLCNDFWKKSVSFMLTEIMFDG